MMSKHRILTSMLATIVAGAGTPATTAQTQREETWSGPPGDLWSQPESWGCGKKETECIPNNNGEFTYVVLIPTGEIATLNVMAPSIDRMEMEPGSLLNVFRSLFVMADPDGTGEAGTIFMPGATITLTNIIGGIGATGPVAGTLSINGVIGNSAHVVLTNNAEIFGGGQTLRLGKYLVVEGWGRVGLDGLTIINDGWIVGNVPGGPLIVDPGVGGLVNTGLLRAADGGLLHLGPGTFDNTAGFGIEALDASVVEFDSATILGGRLATTGTGEIVAAPIGRLIDVTNAGLLAVAPAGTLHLEGTLDNSGTLVVRNELSIDTDVSLTGGGVVTMIGTNARITDSTITNTLTNVDNTIHGEGSFGWLGTLRIVNEATVVADGSAPLTIWYSFLESVNTGVMRAENGATLAIREDSGGSLNNVGGLIEALDGSLVDLQNQTILGGTLDTAGSGEVVVAGARLIDVANAGLLAVAPAGTLHLEGTLENAGFLEVRSGNVIVDTDVNLTGGGLVTMIGANARIADDTITHTLTNVDNTIRGEGSLGWLGTTRIVNEATVVADGPTPLVVWHSFLESVNTGVMRAEGGATLRIRNDPSGSLNNAGGLIEALDGSLVDLANVTILGGTLDTTGTGEAVVAACRLIDVENTGRLVVAPAGVLSLEGTLHNQGSLEVNDRLIIDTDVSLTGGGTVTMIGSTAKIGDNTNTHTLTNVDNTVHGEGLLGLSTTRIVNEATIIADGPTPLIVFSSFRESVNTGVMRAEGGATLRIKTGSGSLNNVGGLIEAIDGSRVEFENASILGGTLDTADTGESVVTASCRLIDVTNTGRLAVAPASALSLEGTLHNPGSLDVHDRLIIDTDVSLTGGGTVTMIGAARVTNSTGTRILTNVDNTMHGEGLLGLSVTGIVNLGAIVGDTASPLSIWGSNAVGLDNRGTLAASGAGGVEVNGTFTTSGVVTVAAASSITRNGDYTQTAGSTTVDGVLTVSGHVDLQGGCLRGSGSVSSSVDNIAGCVAPGNSTGILALGGSYFQTFDASFEAEFGGLVAGDGYDQLQVTGNVTLGGALVLSLVDDFEPQVGDEFTIITATGEITGQFDVVDCTIGFDVEYQTQAVVAVYGGSPCIADADCSGDVGFGDILGMLAAWGPYDPCPPYRPEDIDEDCVVGFSDVLAVLGTWGACP